MTFGSLLSQIRLSSVCLSSVTFVRHIQGAETFGNISLLFCRPIFAISFDLRSKFYGDRPRGTHPSGGGVKRKRGCEIERCHIWVFHLLRSFFVAPNPIRGFHLLSVLLGLVFIKLTLLFGPRLSPSEAFSANYFFNF